jgi:hypothetical protein
MNDTGCLSAREKLIGMVLASPPLLLVLALIVKTIAE